MGRRRYQADGFIPVEAPPARRHVDADTDTFVKGDAIHNDGSGYFTNATTAFDATFAGICAASYDNSGGSQGGVTIEIYPFDTETQYIVPVANALITQAAIGTVGSAAFRIMDEEIEASVYGAAVHPSFD